MGRAVFARHIRIDRSSAAMDRAKRDPLIELSCGVNAVSFSDLLGKLSYNFQFFVIKTMS
jgi:hypothetical protein